MNKELIEKIENKVNNINILDKDTFVEESCKNVYRALLVIAENENPPINDISTILNDTNKTIDLLEKFDSLNKEKYNGSLSYIFIDINNKQTLLYLIELLRQSIHYNEEANDKKTTNDIKIDKNININKINEILSSVFSTSQRANIEKIDGIKFLPSKAGYTIEVKVNHDKLYYMGADEYGNVQIVMENSLDGKIIFADDDYIPPTTNNFEEKEQTDNSMKWLDEKLDLDDDDQNNSKMSKTKNFFHIDSKNNDDVTKFAQEHGYKGAKYIGNWKEYKAYEPYVSGNDISYTGLPLVILVNNKGEIRMSTSDEAMATLDDKSFMESYEENKRDDANNKLNSIINNIDDKIAELKQEQSNTSSSITDNTVYKIDTNYQDKIDENRKFSIIDKSVEELITAKNKCINDWLELLFTGFDELWVMNSSFYRTKIDSILNAIIRRTNDSISLNQLERLKEAQEHIQNRNKEMLMKVVIDLKTMDL